jgi:ArsR family transcriptional regulator
MRTSKVLAGCCGLIDPGMGEDEAGAVAERFKALGDAVRVRMVNLLARSSELCVCDLQANFRLAQPTISHHLSVLKRAGLIESEVRGRWAFYRIREDALRELGQVLEVTR